MFKRLSIIIIVLSINAYSICSPKGALTVDLIAKIDWTATLPLRFAGATILPGRMADVSGSLNSPVCKCLDPFPRIGVPVAFYEPSRIIEVVKDAYCFPTIGTGSSVPFGGGTAGDAQDRSKTFYQAHYMIFPVYSLLEIITDLGCLESGGVDYAYITEVDPFWNSDELTIFLNPEALLFGNPIANLACIADSVASTVFNPIDPLFWCKGAWGNAYPLTGWTNSKNMVEDSASVAASIIYKLHRELILWGSWGQAGLCGHFPMPIWRKSAYRLQIATPVPFFATTIGTSGLLWNQAKNPPFIGDNFGYILFKKRDCCAL